MFIFTSLKKFLGLDKVRPCTRSDLARQQRGNASVLIIIILIVLFSVMLSGGSGSLTSGNIPSPEPTKTDDDTPAGPTTPPATPTPSTQWNISTTFLGCNVNGFPKAQIDSSGNENGYIVLEIDNGSGSFDYIASANFLSPASRSYAILHTSRGFGTKPWKVNLYSGGSKASDGKWSGGTLKSSANGNPTGC